MGKGLRRAPRKEQGGQATIQHEGNPIARYRLTHAGKKSLCQRHAQKKGITEVDLAAWAAVKFKKAVNRSTVSKILKQRARWLACADGDTACSSKGATYAPLGRM